MSLTRSEKASIIEQWVNNPFCTPDSLSRKYEIGYLDVTEVLKEWLFKEESATTEIVIIRDFVPAEEFELQEL